MEAIKVPSREQVNNDSQLIFDQIQKKLGKVPNLYAAIGYSANALKGLLDFEAAFSKGVFSAKEREAIYLVVSELNGCNYCLAAHTLSAVHTGFTKEETLAIRAVQSSDPKLQAILELTRSVVENRGHVSEAELNNFLSFGWHEDAVIELTGLVAARIFTNYVYALTNVPVDFPAADPIK